MRTRPSNHPTDLTDEEWRQIQYGARDRSKQMPNILFTLDREPFVREVVVEAISRRIRL